MHWGNTDAADASDSKAVFDVKEGTVEKVEALADQLDRQLLGHPDVTRHAQIEPVILVTISGSTLSIFDLTVDFIGFGWRAARQPNPMKSTVKSKMDKVESGKKKIFHISLAPHFNQSVPRCIRLFSAFAV